MTPIAVYAIPGPRDGDRVQRFARTVLVADISDILPPER